MNVGLGGVTLTSVSSYTGSRRGRGARLERSSPAACDHTRRTVPACRLTRGSTLELGADRYHDAQDFSQELRLASDGGDAFEWLVGAFYQDIDRDYGQNLPTPGYDEFLASARPAAERRIQCAAGHAVLLAGAVHVEAVRAVRRGTYRFSDQWSLTGGLRYYDYDEDRLLTFAGVFADVGYTREPGSTSSDGFSPRVILAFEPNEDVLLSAQVARGFRLGGINDPLNVDIVHGGRPRDLQRPAGRSRTRRC